MEPLPSDRYGKVRMVIVAFRTSPGEVFYARLMLFHSNSLLNYKLENVPVKLPHYQPPQKQINERETKFCESSSNTPF